METVELLGILSYKTKKFKNAIKYFKKGIILNPYEKYAN